MTESSKAVWLMATGALPGVVCLLATIVLWLRRIILEADLVRGCARVAYGWLALWVVAGLLVTRGAETNPVMVALGWIATPAFATIIGVWVFTERQRLSLDRFPSLPRMRELTDTAIQQSGFVLTELQNDLARVVAAQSALASGAAKPRPMSNDGREVDETQTRLRAAIKDGNEVLTRARGHLQQVTAASAAPDAGADGLLAALQRGQRDVDRLAEGLADAGIACRVEVNRVLANLIWT